ncbi:MAG: TetR/AcrR family transcriptional regulator [Steroidobacteraceae bacterium]
MATPATAALALDVNYTYSISIMKTRQPPVGVRGYRMGRRQIQVDRTRAKLVAAARRILLKRGGLSAFGLDSVARQAGVTRLTVYHQFGSKVGLLEAVYDDLARRGRIAEQLGAAFQLPDPLAGLNAVVAAFISFWSSERLAIRRLRSMAVLDPSFKGATDRDERRLAAMRNALGRLAAARGQTLSDPDRCARVLAMLTSYESFDALAGAGRDVGRVLATIQGLVQAAVAMGLR